MLPGAVCLNGDMVALRCIMHVFRRHWTASHQQVLSYLTGPSAGHIHSTTGADWHLLALTNHSTITMACASGLHRTACVTPPCKPLILQDLLSLQPPVPRRSGFHRLLLCRVAQVLSEMIISNESNILASRVLSHFNRSRQLLFTIKLRYKDLEKASPPLLSLACGSMSNAPNIPNYSGSAPVWTMR